MNRTKRRGFTLIELMVVILILAILAALIVPKVMGRADDAKRAKASSDIASLRTALSGFKLDCDRYPTTEEGLEALRTAPSDVKNWRGPYLDRPLPLDPWQMPYVYEYIDDNHLTVISYGPDKAPGGEGDAAADIGVEDDQK
jgi:general secretion pathway protein G